MGIAMVADGRSVISSVGTKQSMLWFRDRAGERQVTSEGFAMNPRLSADRKKLYYLARSSETRAWFGGHLWEVDLESGRRERLLPDFIVTNYSISNDGERILFIAIDSEERTHLWLAPLDRRRPPREVPSPAPFEAVFGGQGELFVTEREGSTYYLYRMREDGTDRQRVLPDSTTRDYGGGIAVSPNGRWVLVTRGRPGTEKRLFTVYAYPVEGGEAAPVCDDCFVDWGPGGKFLYVSFGFFAAYNVAIPIPSGEALPALPDNGLQGKEDARALPDVRILESGEIAPGPDPSIYAFVRSTVQRNLYRIPLPR
jgi:Tol biopolymer transport system component